MYELSRKLLAVFALLAVLAACSGSEDADRSGIASESPGASERSTPSEADIAESTEGGESEAGDVDAAGSTGRGTFRYAVFSGEANSLDPHLNTQTYGPDWFSPAYDTLIGIGEGGEYVPGLATDWEFSDDGSVFTIHLRDDVTFHDGERFDAAAVAANIERGQSIEGSFVAPQLELVSAVEVVDDYTVELQLTEPSALILLYLSDKAGMMVSPAAADSGDLSVEPVGTGPFTVVSYDPGVQAVYERNPDYWGEAPQVQRVEVSLLADTDAGLNALRSDQVDMYQLTGQQAQQLEGAEDVRVVQQPSWQTEWVMLNLAEPFDDVRVRQALSHATDREAINEFAADGQVTWQFAPEGTEVYDPALEDLYPYDPERARELLSEAGYADGFDFTLNFSARPYTQSIAEILQAQWAEVGITVNLESTDGATTVEKCVVNKECDALAGIYRAPADVAAIAQELFTENAPRNLAADTTVPEIDEALDAALAPGEDRVDALRGLNQTLAELTPYLVMRNVSTIFGLQPRVEHADVTAAGTVDFSSVVVSES